MMKKSILMFSVTFLLLTGGMNKVYAQEQPVPKKDTVNMDTDAKPTFYYPVDDEKTAARTDSDKGSVSTIALIGGVVVVAGAAGFFLIKKKK